MDIQSIPINLLLPLTGLGVASSILVAHILLAHRWRHHELPRRTVGIAIVLSWLTLLSGVGLADAITVLITWVLFGIAGAVTAAGYTVREVLRDQQEAEKLQSLAGDIEDWLWGGSDGLPKN
jgi:hypothetical protein